MAIFNTKATEDVFGTSKTENIKFTQGYDCKNFRLIFGIRR